MGKGGGCVPSKKVIHHRRHQKPGIGGGTDVAPVDSSHADLLGSAGVEGEVDKSVGTRKIYVVFYSMYGHVELLARRVHIGASSVAGVQASLFRVPETFSSSVLRQMQADAPKSADIPVMVSPETQLLEADGFLFGFPARFGSMAAQMQAFFESASSLWKQQSLAGKPAGFFVCTGTQGGGQETTPWAAITQLANQGMLFVPLGYTFRAGMFEMDELRGGSPYGAGAFSGNGTRLPSETELALAEHQGRYMATIVKKMSSK